MKAFLEKQRHSSCRRYSIEYKKVKLGDICKIRSGGTPSSKVTEYYTGNIPFLSINDMTSQGKHVTETAKHITEDAINSCSTWKAPAGSIVYSMCASVGFVSMVDVDFCMNQAIAVLTNLNKDVDKEYLYYILTTLQGSDQLESVITTGAQRNINATILKNMIVNLPPLEHQLLISSLLSSYDSLIATVQSEQDSLMKIKSQLMTDIFS